MGILLLEVFSDKYLKSKDNPDEQGRKYYYQINNIANNILEIKVYSGLSDVSHNLDYNYKELYQLLVSHNHYNQEILNHVIYFWRFFYIQKINYNGLFMIQ